jgi:putative transposase
MPLAIMVDGANLHDVKLLCATLDGIVIARPEPTEDHPEHLCEDAAYDSTQLREEVEKRHYLPHIHRRREEKQDKACMPGYRPRRWVVKCTHFWLNRSRLPLVRLSRRSSKTTPLFFIWPAFNSSSPG